MEEALGQRSCWGNVGGCSGPGWKEGPWIRARWCPPGCPLGALTGCLGTVSLGLHFPTSVAGKCHLGALPAGGFWLGDSTADLEGRVGRGPQRGSSGATCFIPPQGTM